VDPEEFVNSVGLAVTTRRSARSHATLETCLLTAGIQVEHTQSESGAALPQNPSQLPAGSVMRMGHQSSTGSKISDSNSDDTSLSQGRAWDPDLLRWFFANGRPCVRMNQVHASVDSLVRHVVNVDSVLLDEETMITHASTRSSASAVMIAQFWHDQDVGCRCTRTRGCAYKLVSSWLFKNFFLLLTFYALFGSDLALLLGNAETDRYFLFMNIAVSGLFFLEFWLLALGRAWYVLSMAALLDVVALLSMVVDTWFLASDLGLLEDQNSSRLSSETRSARFTRLVQLAKVARAARLLPRLLHLVRRQQSSLARGVLLKKVWRAFVFLDTDGDGLVSMLDLKVFYFNVLQECENMLFTRRQQLLRADVGVFERAEAAALQRDLSGKLNFHEFSRIFLSTRAGKDLLTFFSQDIEEASTVWALTNRLSDGVALKVCFLVLVLVVAISAFEADKQDRSHEQGLLQLDFLARTQHASQRPNSTYLCSQIATFSLRHEVLLLFLDGRTYFEGGQCLPAGVPASELEPFARAETLMRGIGRRASEVLQACLPGNATCGGGGAISSMALLDQKVQAREGTLFSVLTMVAIVVLLTCFVLVLKVKIQKFTALLVSPLRSLADDMMAMSSLEMLTADKELEAPFPEPTAAVSEIQVLQEALLSMRSTIRSWSMYVPPCVVQRLFSRGLEATIGVAKCDVSILFCDIDGFEDACGGMEPKEVLALLSKVLGKIADVIQERQGTLLEFIGDEVLAVFNTPNFLKHHIYAAVASALEIHDVVDGLPKMVLHNGEEIAVRCRIGLHSASILAGNIGSKNRMKYGMLGDGVNLAARLKTLNSRYKTRTLASSAVLENRVCSKMFVHRPVDVVAVKGKKLPTVVYEVIGAASSRPQLLRKAAALHTAAFQLYRERQFPQAAGLFSQAASLFVTGGLNDRLAVQMRRKCSTYMEKPPPEDWDGVERLNRKSWDPGDEGLEKDLACEDANLNTLAVLDALEPPEAVRVSRERRCYARFAL